MSCALLLYNDVNIVVIVFSFDSAALKESSYFVCFGRHFTYYLFTVIIYLYISKRTPNFHFESLNIYQACGINFHIFRFAFFKFNITSGEPKPTAVLC